MGSHPPPPSSNASTAPLRVVYMGTPALAAHVLQRLIRDGGAHAEVVSVVTRPDQPRNRGLKLEPSEVGAVAAQYQIPTLKPTKVRTPEFVAELQAFKPDLLVVVAYGRILPNAVLDTPRLMPINVHASLLPRHRGAAPIEGAILAGDAKSGVTIMRITEKMDAGPILLQRELELAPDETQGSLKERLAELGATALLDELDMLRQGKLVATQQNESLVTYTSPVKKQDSRIDWNADAVVIERIVRAYDPWPVARTSLGAENLMIWKTRVILSRAQAESEVPPGAVVSIKPLPVIKCGSGALELVEVQLAGRKRIAAADFAHGHRLAVGARLGS